MFKRISLLFCLVFFLGQGVFAQAVLNEAVEKFYQSNIVASYSDFEEISKSIPVNDFAYMILAEKMRDFGYFNLADSVMNKVSDKEIYGNYIEEMKEYCFPNRKVTREEEIRLAEFFSDINFNNKGNVAVNELLKNRELVSKSDFANYVLARGYYKMNYMMQARQYIDLALIQNPKNINYQILKAKILASTERPDDALKVISNLKRNKYYYYGLEEEILITEEYILSRTSLKQWDRDYHLARHYYLKKEYLKATKILLTVSAKEKYKGNIYALLAQIYVDTKDLDKAKTTLKKALKINDKNPIALKAQGDIRSLEGSYKQALVSYKKYSKYSQKSQEALLKVAETYSKLGKLEKSDEIYLKLLKLNLNPYEAYYYLGVKDNNKNYIKKSLSINNKFKPAWVKLAILEPVREHEYLTNALYIDQNDFKYYDKINSNMEEKQPIDREIK